MSVFAEKMLLTVLGAGLLAASCWPPLAPVAVVLSGAGGSLLGKAWMDTPEYARHKESIRPKSEGKP